jgi:hypothetical protein
MDRNQILEAINEEITRLERVRALLSSTNGHRTLKAAMSSNGAHAPKKRILSEEARNRIAQAQKRRWAKHRKEIVAVAKA